MKIYSRFAFAGECINLGANKAPGFVGGTVSNYIVFYSADTGGDTYTLTINTVGSGSVTRDPSGPYVADTEVELNALPAAGWQFSGWSGDLTGNANPAYITMDGNKTVTATFIEVSSSCAPLSARFYEATLEVGLVYYTDRDYTLTSVLGPYVGMEAIITPNNDYNRTDASDYLTFTMPYDGMVYVAFDSRATSLPDWASGFVDTGDSLLTSLATQPALKIYSRFAFAGECINLGANKAPGFVGGTVSNYIVLYE